MATAEYPPRFLDMSYPRKSLIHKQMAKMKDTKVLPSSEWDRIQFQLHKNEIDAAKRQAEKQAVESLRNKSKDLVKNWSNTLAGLRENKLAAKHLREERIETDRKRVDIEHAKMKADERRQAIEKAKEKLYHETDRVRSLHGAYMLSEVLKERDAQQQLKKQRDLARKQREKQDALQVQEDYKKYLDEQKDDRIKSAAEGRKRAEYLFKQLQENMDRDREERLELLEDAKRLQSEIDKEKEEQERQMQKKKEQRLQWQKEQLMDADERQRIRYQLAEEAQKEEDKIKAFADAKRKMARLTAQKQKQISDERLRYREAISNTVASQLKKKLENEELRLRNAVEQLEEKTEQDLAAKQAKQAQALKELDEFAKSKIAARKQLMRDMKMQELEEAKEMWKAYDEYVANEREKEKRKKQKLLELLDFHKKQQSEASNYKNSERSQQKADALAMWKAMLDEESQFQEYAKELIEEQKNKGRNIIPLLKASKPGIGGGMNAGFEPIPGITVRPKYLSAISGSDMPAVQNKDPQSTRWKDTYKPLGFDGKWGQARFVSQRIQEEKYRAQIQAERHRRALESQEAFSKPRTVLNPYVIRDRHGDSYTHLGFAA